MRILIFLVLIWPGTLVANSCSKEQEALKTAENKLKQCKDKPKKLSPREAFTKEWTVVRERQLRDTKALHKKHTDEYEALIKKHGFDPRK